MGRQLGLLGQESGAEFSRCERYRWRLWRSWQPLGTRCAFVMLNPSTADETNDDPTIRRCIRFAKDWGHGSLEIVNIFAWRSTDPKALYQLDDPVGPDNDDAIRSAARAASQVICTWGNHGGLHRRSAHVLDMLRPLCTPQALLVTKQDQPGHPLYRPASTAPFNWDERDRPA